MNSPDRSAADLALAQGFATHVVQWAHRYASLPRDNETMLHAMALQTSLASSAGHVCARLQDIAALHPEWTISALRLTLLNTGVTGTLLHPGAFPLILDDEDRLYLHRYFDYENRLACNLAQRVASALMPISASSAALLKEQLATLFDGNQSALQGAPDWQKIGAALALLRPLTILSGGPGTGKTTTVVNLLACLLTLDVDCRIVLAAPTGKAAARMLEALRARAQHLPASIQQRLPSESFTVHRLLGATHKADEYRHHANNLLALDVLIVDEASMLDLALATHLFAAVPTAARIVLLGDKDQLSAVESGAVFAELSADPTLDATHIAALADLCNIPATSIYPAAPIMPTALSNSVVWFRKNFRFSKNSGIGLLAAYINAGDAETALQSLQDTDEPSIGWLPSTASDCDAESVQCMLNGYASYVDMIRTVAMTDAPPDDLFAAFNRFRVLCALRDTPRGTDAVNRLISRHIRSQLGAADSTERSPWYTGRPVMVLQNDYATRLFNGDIGIAIVDADGNIAVWFADADQTLRRIAPARLPEHETAFATTVHKSQGSEFEQVMLVLPAQSTRVLSRELLYTAVTRASGRVIVAGGADLFCEAVQRPTVRFSGLTARLAAAAAAIAVEVPHKPEAGPNTYVDAKPHTQASNPLDSYAS